MSFEGMGTEGRAIRVAHDRQSSNGDNIDNVDYDMI